MRVGDYDDSIGLFVEKVSVVVFQEEAFLAAFVVYLALAYCRCVV